MSSPPQAPPHPLATPQRYGQSLRSLGLVLIGLGIVELLCVALGVRPLLGTGGLRKSVIFFFSTGLTVWSLGWIRSLRERAAWNTWIDGLLGVSLTVEVLAIALQDWFGRASHFNHETLRDTVIERTMLACIVVATGIIVADTVRCFGALHAPRSTLLAIRAGMIFLTLSCALGFAITAIGWTSLGQGRAPGLFGQAGVLKFPHGATIHALQSLPLIAWLALHFRRRFATALVVAGIVGHGLWLLFALRQTALGRGRLDPDPLNAGLLLAIALVALASLILAAFPLPGRGSVSSVPPHRAG